MEIQQLRHFLAVARYGSIGQASEVLNLSQPGLSRSIRALEDVLGLAVFERQARGVTLTDHGKQLLRRAEVIVNEHDRAIDDARSAGSLRSGDVRLGLHDIAQGVGAVDALNGFLDLNPAVSLSIEVTSGATLVERVALANLDLAFTLFPIERRGNEVQFERLFEFPCHIYQRRNCAHSIQGVKSISELLDRQWVLSGGLNFRVAFEERLAKLGLAPPTRFLQSSSLAFTLELLLSRDILTVLPVRVAQSPQLVGKLERCDVVPPGNLPGGGLIYRKEALRIPAVAAVADAFRAFSAQF